jgi:magnesium-transporting ATPase (P-type)
VPPSGGLAYQQTVEQVLAAHTQSQASGLDRAEAQARLQKHGRTRCRRKKANRPGCVSAHFNDVLIYVLLAAAVLTAVMGHWVDTLVILGVAVINALIGHIQESNAKNP